MSSDANIEATLRAVEPAARLVHERRLRQVIYYLIDRGRPLPTNTDLPFWFSRHDLESADLLPSAAMRGTEERLLLVTEPDDRLIADRPRAEQLREYWRVLFRAGVMKAIDARLATGELDGTRCREKLNHFGGAAAREIRFVLESEHLLAAAAGDADCYRTFAAVYLDLARFTAHANEEFFPGLPHGRAVHELLAEDVDSEAVFLASRPAGAAEPDREPLPDEVWVTPPAVAPAETAPPVGEGAKLLRRAEEAERKGNGVRAAILRTQAATASRSRDRRRATELAHANVRQLVERLGDLLEWDAATRQEWRQALAPVLPLAASGEWPRAARCLYELQRIPADYSREVYAVELHETIRTLGRRPVRRPLPHARPVMILMALRKAHQQLLRSRLGEREQLRLDRLLHHEIHRREHAIRREFTPIIAGTLTGAGLVPTNRVEEVARDKLVAELLDRVCEQGYLRIGDLRDAVARNQLKLQDLQGFDEFVSGDALLRADAGLSHALDGVYRRGEFYLRGIQQFFSLFFGTPWGRALVLYLALPFGGAFLALMFAEELHHLGGKAGEFATRSLWGRPQKPVEAAAEPAPDAPAEHPAGTRWMIEWNEDELAYEWERASDGAAFDPDEGAFVWWEDEKARDTAAKGVRDILTSSQKKHGSFLIWWPTIIGAGAFLLLVFHVAPFRRAVFAVLRFLWRVVRKVFWDAPRAAWQSDFARSIRQSRVARFIDRHISTPLLLSLLLLGVALLAGVTFNILLWFGWVPFVALLVFYNLPTGWEVQDRIAEAISDWWRVVRVNLIPGLIATFIDAFRVLANWVERQLYAVDEWMRFRGGDSRGSLWMKAVLGLLWFPVAYFTRFVFYLLAEPQFNPVKHFPVVTVSHKVIAPVLFALLPSFAEVVGEKPAGTIIFFTQLLLPGVFGFLAWELKENWRLYAANRSARLPRVVVGSHGETVRGLLRPGFHSGTVPKIRRKMRKESASGNRAKAALLHHELEHAAEGVHRFAERDLIPFLAGSREWGGVPVEVREVHFGVQRAVILLAAPSLGLDPFALALENINGVIEASVARLGWADKLTDAQREVFTFALRGFLDMASAARFDGRPREPVARAEPGFSILARRVSWDEWVRGWGKEVGARG